MKLNVEKLSRRNTKKEFDVSRFTVQRHHRSGGFATTVVHLQPTYA